jgi:hypothetical protein
MANVDSRRKSKGDKKAKKRYNVYKKGGRDRAKPLKEKESKK